MTWVVDPGWMLLIAGQATVLMGKWMIDDMVENPLRLDPGRMMQARDLILSGALLVMGSAAY